MRACGDCSLLSSTIAISSANLSYIYPTVRRVVVLWLGVCLLWSTSVSATRQAAEEPEAQTASQGEALLDRWQAEDIAAC